MDELNLIGRSKPLLENDILNNEARLEKVIKESSFLVIGGAGSIGQAVVKEIFSRKPKKIHVVDLSENNLVELVRDLRSSYGYIDGDFRTFAIDCGSTEFEVYFNSEKTFDYVLNLSALKHVRSERDPFTLMRMIQVNILNTIKTIELSIAKGVKNYFCVSTDKAANPVNLMGASKRIMELFLSKYADKINISTARFANVAFSEGSLLQGFIKRLEKKQPISAPNDVRRYFVTFQEAGQICMLATILGGSREIFFPKLNEDLNMEKFSDIARRYLEFRGFTPIECVSEDEARSLIENSEKQQKWPCYFSSSDTTGEKEFEEFYMDEEIIDLDKFISLGVVKNLYKRNENELKHFIDQINNMKKEKKWTKEQILDEFILLLPEFKHMEKGKNLDNKM